MDEESRNEGQSNLSIDCAALPDSSAFSWRAAGSAIGSMSGSALGGLLSEPNGRIPLLSDIKVFQVNPYAAPGVLLLLLSMIASASVILLVKEVSTLTEETDGRRILVSKKRTASKILQSHGFRSHPRLQPREHSLRECCSEADVSCKSASQSSVCLTDPVAMELITANRTCAFACLALLVSDEENESLTIRLQLASSPLQLEDLDWRYGTTTAGFTSFC